MKPFDLEKALAGEPVRLRNGCKAFVKYQIPDEFHTEIPLSGYFLKPFLGHMRVNRQSWRLSGSLSCSIEHEEDIVAMWEEPRPRVQLDLPCPLKEPQEGMWYISSNNQNACKSGYCKGQNSSFNEDELNAGRYFASEEDANEWINAMKESRR